MLSSNLHRDPGTDIKVSVDIHSHRTSPSQPEFIPAQGGECLTHDRPHHPTLRPSMSHTGVLKLLPNPLPHSTPRCPPSSPSQKRPSPSFQVLRPKALGHPGLLSFSSPSANPDGTTLRILIDPESEHFSPPGLLWWPQCRTPSSQLPSPILTPVCSRYGHQRAHVVI